MTAKIDWDTLGFSFTPTDFMYRNTCQADGVWGEGEILPFGDISLSPAAAVLNYGQGLFEGLKAQRTQNNNIVLFRPSANGQRLVEGAERLLIPPFPPEKFVEAIKEVVRKNIEYVPPYGKGSLYLRPCLWGTGPILGVAPASSFMLIIFACPVGPYYKGDLQPVKFKITNNFHRAAPKGVGNVKFIGNYTGGLMVSRAAKKEGYSGCIFLDAKEDKYIEEVETSNFFCVVDGKLFTPALGSILPGVTRDSIIQLAREKMGLEVIEKQVSVSEAQKASECFCTGTAAVITPIGAIEYQGKETVFNDFNVGPITQHIYNLLTHIQLQEAEDTYGWVEII
jgi:branched-chain amino acid aminotransferase